MTTIRIKLICEFIPNWVEGEALVDKFEFVVYWLPRLGGGGPFSSTRDWNISLIFVLGNRKTHLEKSTRGWLFDHRQWHNQNGYILGSWRGAAPFLWNTPSTKTPFFPLQIMKKLGCSKKTSKCRLDMKEEWPMLTSTWPLDEFLPITSRLCRTRNSNSLPSILAMTAGPLLSAPWFQWWAATSDKQQ